MDRAPMTVRGEKLLREELKKLKNEDRPRIVKEIAIAREHGDLRENAEYHAAREQQGFIEGRIKEIEARLSLAEVIDITQIKVEDRVVFGATVEVFYEDTEEEAIYHIVGQDEAQAEDGIISFISPIARALIGQEVGEVVTIKTPGGERPCEIVDVHYVDNFLEWVKARK